MRRPKLRNPVRKLRAGIRRAIARFEPPPEDHWFDRYHIHLDWHGIAYSIRRDLLLPVFNAALRELFNTVVNACSRLPSVEVYAIHCPEEPWLDAVYIHTPNPQSTFPWSPALERDVIVHAYKNTP